MAEKEYIEREAVVERINNSIRSWSRDYNSNAPRMVSAYKDVLFRIQNVPTADVTDIVRCKDCTHRYVPARCALWVGNENGKDIFLERGDDFFCKYGERKDTDDTK